MMNIISASRRTDIPAFYMSWLMQRLEAGAVSYPNPFGGEVYTVSLRPEDVHSIVFWSKNYGPFLPHMAELEARGYSFYCHYTLTGTPRAFEPHVPDPLTEGVPVLRELARRTSPRHVQWRFDPIIFTAELGEAFYLERFRELAAALEGATERCYFSFATFYGKAIRQLKRAGVNYRDPALEEKQSLVRAMADVAEAHGMKLYACCQASLATGRVRPAHCIDGELLASLFPDRPLAFKAGGTRAECGCVSSRDLGMYDTCPHSCLYCYANRDPERALARASRHSPEGEMLVE